ncbi:MAG: DUF1003 domain-containing protein [Acidimicrobiia bacterium]
MSDPSVAGPTVKATRPPTDRPQGHRRGTARENWRHHPAVRVDTELSRGERAADTLRNGMGSWGFIVTALIFLAGWMLGNRNTGFDKYPFILLNLILSCLAAMQGAILLIAAKREDQVASELARHDFETNVEADRIVKMIHALTVEIHHTVVGPELGPRDGGVSATPGTTP